ncbi:MAG: choice-of-anchor J domain-containing protein [Bacteroidales bacterium]|nr:choice-of-anchor J domain-containing protein [Bacteroidales bacterium]
MAWDVTYDETDGMIYGWFYNEYGNEIEFGVMDPATRSTTKIRTIGDEEIYLTLAADNDGALWAIDYNGDFYSVDKATGNVTLIGNTGVEVGFHLQSACFDPYTNILYWASCEADETSNLYQVDTTTGKATLVAPFIYNEEVVGLCVHKQSIDNASPAAVTDLAVDFSKGTLTGTVSFVMPSTTFMSNEALTGQVDYRLLVNDVEAANGSAAPGATVSETVTVEGGNTRFVVIPSNDKGDGPQSSLTTFLGSDVPQAVTNLGIYYSDGVMEIWWSAPTSTGVNGGFVDTSAIRYDIVRLPDNVVVASDYKYTSFEEDIEVDCLKAISYTVTPKYDGMEGETSTSSSILLGTEYPLSTPYAESFDEEYSFQLFTVIDVANDGKTWKRYYEPYYDDGVSDPYYALCPYHESNPKDDWLITPPIYLEAGTRYVFKFDAKCSYYGFPEKLEVAYGQGFTAADMTTVLLEASEVPADVDENDDTIWHTYLYVVEPATSGSYNFGFHAVSDADLLNLSINDIAVEEATSYKMPYYPELTLIPGADGALTLHVEIELPTTTLGGEELSEISLATVSLNGYDMAYIDNPEPGSTYSYDFEVETGENTVTVTLENSYGTTPDYSAKAYCGIDFPVAPSNLEYKVDAAQDIVYLTWDAPTEGENGGYINPESLVYWIGPRTSTVTYLYTQDWTETSYTDNWHFFEEQTLVRYRVYAQSEAGVGTNASTSSLIIGGTPYSLPFVESVPGCSFQTDALWAVTQGASGAYWSTSEGDDWNEIYPVDEDGGLFCFEAGAYGDESLIYTGKIATPGSGQFTLTYNYYSYWADATLTVKIKVDNGEWEDLETITLNQSDWDWVERVVDLSAYSGANYIQIGFNGQGRPYFPIYIDAISIEGASSGISSAISDGAANEGEEYYTISGVKVNHPTASGVYLVKKNGIWTKQIVK